MRPIHMYILYLYTYLNYICGSNLIQRRKKTFALCNLLSLQGKHYSIILLLMLINNQT